MTKSKNRLIIHPFLFAIYPILFLYSYNINMTFVGDIFYPILLSILMVVIFLILFRFIVKDIQKRSVFLSFLILQFFSYNKVKTYINTFPLFEDIRITIGNFIIGPNKLIVLCNLLFFIFILYFLKIKKNINTFTKFLNATSVFLIIMPLFIIGKNIALTSYKNLSCQSEEVVSEIDYNTTNFNKDTFSLPNIFYIVLDAYGRNDILKEIYNIDNKNFMNYLKDKGFYIPSKSCTNYGQTSLSICSSLNFNYIDKILSTDSTSNDRRLLRNFIRGSKISKILKSYGYRVVSFSSGYEITEIVNADIYMNTSLLQLSFFHNALISQTIIPYLLSSFSNKDNFLYNMHRKRIKYTLEELKNVPKLPSPYFVFAHILCPHPPFVFDKNGKEITPNREYDTSDADGFMRLKDATNEEYINGYKDQIVFINNQIKDTITNILANSSSPPIIVLQADHGPGLKTNWGSLEKTYIKERFSILNAYHLPDSGDKYLYESISPVNTFRTILNHYFNANYEILPDKSYFSSWEKPYNFIDVTDKVKGSSK